MTLTPADMLSIQHAIDLYEKKFPHQPSPSAEVALAWVASRRGRWWRGIASKIITFFRHHRNAVPETK